MILGGLQVRGSGEKDSTSACDNASFNSQKGCGSIRGGPRYTRRADPGLGPFEACSTHLTHYVGRPPELLVRPGLTLATGLD